MRSAQPMRGSSFTIQSRVTSVKATPMNKNPAPKLLFGLPLGLAVAVALLSAPLTAHAGRNCSQNAAERGPDAKSHSVGDRFARCSNRIMSASRRPVVSALINQKEVSATRMLAIWCVIIPPDSGQVIHELNNCGSGSSELFDEGLARFYLDDLYDYET